jgi:hypothetical protein
MYLSAICTALSSSSASTIASYEKLPVIVTLNIGIWLLPFFGKHGDTEQH